MAPRRWSQHVTETSDALDVPQGTFAQDDPAKVARELMHDAEGSKRRKSSPYRSAMSMPTFLINRAGKNLPARRKRVLEQAKEVLREEFGPQAAAPPKTPRKRSRRARSPRRRRRNGPHLAVETTRIVDRD
ncbi:hypothetical protein WPS_23840 [Vulcanimicrobium alpinum]|uniref:DUF3175 domain-containing protein n=1 Tax=Vulcanimicrobium alpinum TaxID=3016050 RepID=A0AAN2CAM7_UNVUL|nr:DUF3175 domain-containing protein [Vulcanimicrobium alpinum]BDE07108.1 hypothetical protein WPS_23840 [Vulcanimicrobium alpinum]